MTHKQVWIMPNRNIKNHYYFTVLGKSISFASEFEHECIELSKIHIKFNNLKNNNDGYILDYQKTFDSINEKITPYRALNQYINDLKKVEILDEEIGELFSLAKEIRNKIAHVYAYQFYNNQNDINKLAELLDSLKVDINHIIDAKSLVDLIFRLTIASESNLPIRQDGSSNIDDYRFNVMEWIFSYAHLGGESREG